MALDLEIDALYRLSPSAFTAARNALAKTLAGADAQRVRRLQKPTTVPWVVNQLYWRERRVYDRLLESGRALREVQLATLRGKAARVDVRRASEAHRKALAATVHRAGRLASKADLKLDAEAVARMLEAISLSAQHPAEPGRLARMLQPAGFEALAGLKKRSKAGGHQSGRR